MKPIVSAFFAVLLFSGCTTLDDRIGENRDRWEALPAETQARLKAGDVQIGDEKWMVRVALGEPDGVGIEKTESGEQTVWRYIERTPRLSFGVGGGTGNVGGGVNVGTGGNSFVRIRVVLDENGVVTGLAQNALD